MISEHWEFENEDVVLFWGGILSNWHKSSFTCFGVKWNCVEQYMMAQKAILFNDSETCKAIMEAENPREQKRLGRTVKGFKNDEWQEKNMTIIYPAIFAKYKQNPALAKILMTTEHKQIAEASPYDKVWGIGLHWKDINAKHPNLWQGENKLGKLTMMVRDDIRGDKEI